MAKNLLDTPDTTSYFDTQDIENNKIMALLSYIGFLWLIPMLAAKESKFAQYHVNQGIILTIVGVIAGVAGVVIGLIPILGIILTFVISLIPFVGMILGIMNAVQGKAKELPFVGGYRIIK